MTGAFSKLVCWEGCDRNSAAGGHLEHPSEVKSSITTGVRTPVCVEGAAPFGQLQATAAKTARPAMANPACSSFIEAPFLLTNGSPGARKGFRELRPKSASF